MSKKEFFLRTAIALLGILILSFGIGILLSGNVGTDPYTAANVAVSSKLNIPFSLYQVLINLVLLIYVFIFDRKYIGIGTVLMLFFVGFLIEFFNKLILNFINFDFNFIIYVIFLVLGILIMTFGISLYMSVRVGSAPYDAIAPIVSEQIGMEFKYVRIIQDILFMSIALIFNGPVNVATIISAFFVGALIDFWNYKISTPLLKKV
ncbi:YczE/YyaS/YitT family protein, partial [Anaerosphaera multitolerans]